MTITLIAFYLFAFVLILSALMVVSLKNAVHSAMFLILAFFNAAGIFVIYGAEFLAMLLVIVYVGAVAVLFLFIIMMLNIDKIYIKKEFNKYTPIGILVAFILLVELALVIKVSSIETIKVSEALQPIASNITNTRAIGNVLYTDFAYPFLISGLILFVAMIGAIVLTLREERKDLKRQDITKQVRRTVADSIEIIKS